MRYTRIFDKNYIRCIFKDECYYDLDDLINKFSNEEEYKNVLNKLKNEKIDLNNHIKVFNDSNKELKYIDTYGTIALLMHLSCDYAVKYKKWIISNTIERLREIANPDISIDRINTLHFKKGNDTTYTFKRNSILSKRHHENSDANYMIIKEEIENSENYFSKRQFFQE